MLAFHQKYYQPGGFIFAVSGDFNTKDMLAKLEAAMKGWPVNKQAVPEVPKPTAMPGCRCLHRKQGGRKPGTRQHWTHRRDARQP